MNAPKLRFKEFSSSWKPTTIGECSETLAYGLNAAAKPFDGKNQYIRITDIDDQSRTYIKKNRVSPDCELTDEYLVKENDILFARTGASTGKSYIYKKKDGKLYFAGFLIRARIKKEHDARFVYNVTLNSSYNKWVKVMSMRSGQPGINSQEYSSYSFYLPMIKEQKKISDFFEKLDTKIELQQEKIDLLKEQKKGYMLNIFNNPTWKEIRLGNFSTIKGRLGWKGLKQEEYVEEGPYLIAGKHINEGIIDWNKCDKIPQHRYEESMEIALEKDDIIFSKDGSLGNPAFIRDLPNKATINSTMMLVRVNDKNKLNSNFVYHILNSHIFNKLIYQKVSGSSIPHLFQADMKEFSFKVPEDIKGQIKISNFFNTLDRKIHLELKKLELLKSQKQAFMQQMFI